jgi:hypothetical protein
MAQLLRIHRRPLLALVLACGLALLLLAAPDPALATKTGHDVICYSDAQHTHVTGYHYYCINHSGGWGATTGYCVWQVYPCT